MVAANGTLFSIILLFVSCLPNTVVAQAPLPQDEEADPQGVLNIQAAYPNSPNATVVGQPYDFVYLPASPLENRIRIPRGVYDPLQRRNNYCFSDNTAAYCQDSNLCCTDTAENTGWCCWFTLSCDVADHGCLTPVWVEKAFKPGG